MTPEQVWAYAEAYAQAMYDLGKMHAADRLYRTMGLGGDAWESDLAKKARAVSVSRRAAQTRLGVAE